MKTTAKLLAAALLLTSLRSALADVHYVDVNGTNATSPYTNWITAATNIQDAIDAALAGDEVVVTNGIYATGGRATIGESTLNRVAVDKPLSLRSINGPEFTAVDGGHSVRCAYLTNGVSMSGFTLTNGFINGFGGGVFCESKAAVISNCVVVGNSSFNDFLGAWFDPFGGGVFSGTLSDCTLSNNYAVSYNQNLGFGRGGGAYGAALNNCTLTGNFAGRAGGGADSSTLSNCMLSGNSARNGGGGAASSLLKNCKVIENSSIGRAAGGGGAYYCSLDNCAVVGNSSTSYGGGASDFCTLNNCTVAGNLSGRYGGGVSDFCTLNNCIVYFNTAPQEANYDSSSTLNYSCTTPQPTNGVGNITNAPLFVDQASGNLRLQSNSPCINAGLNAFAPAGLDLDGGSRIAGGTVDIGAYEFQSPASMISYAWLQQFNLPINPLTDAADPDGDCVNNYREWLAGSDPTNPFSFPPLLTLIPYGSNVILTWPTNALGFTLQSSTNPGSPALWSTNSPGPVVIGGQNVIIDSVSGPQQFYRLSQ